MGRYDREERRHDRSEPQGDDKQSSGRRRRFPWDDPDEAGDPAPAPHEPPPDPDPRPSEALGESRSEPVPEGSRAGETEEFPWEEPGGEQPAQVWEEPPAERPAASGGGTRSQGNPLAITGFILSLVMWVTFIVPYLSFVLWILALTFSSIGLSRSRKRGAPYKGLAIAGLCISLVGVVAIIVFAIIAVAFLNSFSF